MEAPIVHVAGYARSPFGKFGGALRTLTLPELGAHSVAAALRRSGVDPDRVDEVAIGVNFPGSDRSIARQVQLRAGIPDDRTSYTVDRACCSSLTAINMASRSIRSGEIGLAVAGGVENLSRVPYFLESARFGRRLGDIVLADQLVVSCPYSGVARAVQASNEAAIHGIGRQEQDEWACRSQERYAAAHARHFFEDEIEPVSMTDGDGSEVTLDHDEVPRPEHVGGGPGPASDRQWECDGDGWERARSQLGLGGPRAAGRPNRPRRERCPDHRLVGGRR